MATTAVPISERASDLGAAARVGVRDIAPMVVGVVPFGLAIGATLATSSISTDQAVFSGPVILAGAAQLAVISMLGDGVAPAVIIASALIINARIVLYSPGLAQLFPTEPFHHRLALAIPVIDQTYFACAPRLASGEFDRSERKVYFWTAGGCLIAGFLVSQWLALAVGAVLPAWTGVGVMAPLVMVGLLAKSVAGRPAIQAAVAAAVVAALGVGLPFQAATIAAIAVGVAVGRVRSSTEAVQS